MLEKAFWIVLSFTVAFALTTTADDENDLVHVPLQNIVRGGSCGDNLTWALDGQTLRITGSGEMRDLEMSSEMPWYSVISSIKAVVIDEGVTTIGKKSFYGCSQLVSVMLPNSLLSIGNNSFDDCGNLTSVTIPDNVLSIGSSAFYGCDNLASVKISASVEYIGSQAFNACEKLETIEVDKNNKHFTSIDGVLFDHECTTIIQYPIGNQSQSYTLPSTVRVIARCSFYGCRRLYTLNIPDSVTTIESAAFLFSYSLYTLTIPESVTTIGDSAFCVCSAFRSLFYQGTAAVSNEIFSGCNNLNTICVPPDYEGGPLFGGKNVTSDATICQQYQKMFNQCFKGSTSGYGSIVIQQKRKNVTDLEKKSNGCLEYECDNETGLIASASCDQMCIDDRCVQKDVENKVGVELELVNGVEAIAMNTTTILDIISSLCDVNVNDLTIGWEVDQQGFIIRVTVFVEDKEIADNIAASVERIKKGEGCKYGLLCGVKSVRVVGCNDLSDSIRSEVLTHLTVFLFLIVINNLSHFQFI